MNIRKKLGNPFVLVAQGFIAGAIIFHATIPPETGPRRAPPAGVASATLS